MSDQTQKGVGSRAGEVGGPCGQTKQGLGQDGDRPPCERNYRDPVSECLSAALMEAEPISGGGGAGADLLSQ